MTRRWRPLAGLLLLAALPAAAADAPDAKALAGRIDHHVGAGWDRAKVKPAPPADDAEFVRRIYLDLAGRIPSVTEVRTFLADKAPDKRARLIDGLLDGPRYAAHFTDVWRSWMLPEAQASIQAGFLAPGFQAWLRKHLSANTPYDQVVFELLTTPINSAAGRPFAINNAGPNPAAFYVAKDVQPENLAASTSRLFLGVRLECAQCHDHPFAEWKKVQFWEYAAFFSGLRRQRQGDFVAAAEEQGDKKEIAIPGSEKIVKAKFLDGAQPQFKDKVPVRNTLAEWVTAPENRYFARATVNRLWEHFLGTGLVEPVDEMVGTDNAPSHPELLDELARGFVASKFDLKFLIRAITLSRPYQLSSRRTDKAQEDVRLFARMPLRGLTGEQLFDSLATATGFRGASGGPPGVVFVRGRGGVREEFLTRFASQTGKATEQQTSILQALAMMNGQVTASATDLRDSETLVAIADNPFMSPEERVETLYLAALSRPPKAKEMSRMLRFVDEAGGDNKLSQGLADVFWALLNSGEFILNH